ncbi:MAG: methyltransferase [Alphaproteobacteria bacterium]|nr:methyltransferase [Alphaproteobacteria bacterium]
MPEYTNDYLLDKQIKIFQPINGYRASSDAVMLSGAVKNIKNGEKVLDMGSGTGAISLCLAQRFPNAVISGIELQSELAELSNLSAKSNNFTNLSFINSDLRTPNSQWYNKFHHVITNPPYSDHDMPSPNESKSQAHNFQNFNLTEWLQLGLKCLRPNGWIYTINRAEAIDEILYAFHKKVGDITIIPFYSKVGQNAKRVIVCARKNSKGPTKILSGITIHDSNGNYTPKAEAILRNGNSLFD